MIRRSTLKLIFLSALAALLFVYWNAELMRHYDFDYDQSYNFLPSNDTYAHMFRKLLYKKKDHQAENFENFSEDSSNDVVINYFVSKKFPGGGIKSHAERRVSHVVTSDQEKLELTTRFLFEASSNLTRPKNAPFSPVANFASSKTSVCLIPKNGHSVVRFVNCLLAISEMSDDDHSYKLFNAQSTFKGAFSKKCNSVINSRRRKRMRGLQKTVFIRDPLERFISGWLFLCKSKKVCFNCGLNFRCFLTTLYNCWKTKLRHSRICRYSSRSRESRFNTSSHLYWHLSPQSSFCHLHEEAEDFKIIEYSKTNVNEFLLSSAKSVLGRDKYLNLDNRIHEKTTHASKGNDSKNLKDVITSDRKLSSMFAQLYYVDYETFGIPIPQFVIDFQLYDNG